MAHKFNKAAAFFTLIVVIHLPALVSEARPSILDAQDQSFTVRRQVPTGPLPLPPHNFHEQVVGECTPFNVGIDNHADGEGWLVQISNLCKCSATHVILNCPNFSSGTHQIDPEVFTVNGDGTCTVKKGKAVTHGEIISFKYYQVLKRCLSVRSVSFGC